MDAEVPVGTRDRRLSFSHQGRDHRLTDVAGNVVEQILA
jgi:hypothetical protein